MIGAHAVFASGCTPDSHEALKGDASAWAVRTYPIHPAPVMGLEWVNCAACHSTIAREVDEEACDGQ